MKTNVLLPIIIGAPLNLSAIFFGPFTKIAFHHFFTIADKSICPQTSLSSLEEFNIKSDKYHGNEISTSCENGETNNSNSSITSKATCLPKGIQTNLPVCLGRQIFRPSHSINYSLAQEINLTETTALGYAIIISKYNTVTAN